MKKRKANAHFIWKVMNDEKTPVDPWLLYDILWGLKALFDKSAHFLSRFLPMYVDK